MYPMNLCEIMRDLVMPRCCFVGFGYAFVVSVMLLYMVMYCVLYQ